jgi:hypothetical protein
MDTAAECPACARWTIFARHARRPRRCVHCLALLDPKHVERVEAPAMQQRPAPLAVA